MRAPFRDPRVGAASGLVLPLELDTEAQSLFEEYGGFSRGFQRLEFSAASIVPASAGRVGAGAAMAFRRALAETLRFFEVELDCGTRTRSGGDVYAFYRVLRRGYRVVYTPEAVAWHRHRRERDHLRSTLRGYSVGVYAFLLRCLHEHRDMSALAVGWQWFRGHHLRQLRRALLRQRGALPLDLVLSEIGGCLEAPYAYFYSRRRERALRRVTCE
jgi:GT2 family glycosyltransferase